MTPEQELDLLMGEPEADGNVIRFKIAFPDGPKTYSYAAMKIAGQWYITGAESKKSRTWVELIDWFKGKNATVITIERATEWENLL